MTTTDRLNDLITAKENIKSVIIEKGVNVTSGLTSYADAIRQIKSGTSSLIEVPINTRFIGSEWTAAPNIETAGWDDMSFMLEFCDSLTTVPLYNTSNVINMRFMFSGCTSLTTVPLFDTSKVAIMYCMFSGCTSLTTVPLFDTSNVINMGYMFGDCTSLTTVGGFKDLGKQPSLNGTDSMISDCSKLTYDSLMNVINNLYDRATAGYSVLTLKLHATVLALLSDEDIAIATNKGWTLQQ